MNLSVMSREIIFSSKSGFSFQSLITNKEVFQCVFYILILMYISKYK